MESLGAIRVMSYNFWKGKNVFLTGHTGFKGAWFSMLLHHLGAKVHGYSLDPLQKKNLYELAQIEDFLVTDTREDIRNKEKLLKMLSLAEADIVVHFAAQALVRESYANPLDTFEINAMGTANLLSAIQQIKKPMICLVITTDKVYSNNEWCWGYRENDRLGGKDPYSSSKACAELIVSSYRDSFFPINKMDSHEVAISTARAGNVIGGGDFSKDRLIPDIVEHFANEKVLKIRSPNSVRPWEHVLEPLSQYTMLIERMWNDKEKFSGAWNFGPSYEDAVPVSKICEMSANIWGEGSKWEVDKEEHPAEAGFLYLDISKAKSMLKYRPRFNIQQALEMTFDWYKNAKNCEEARKIMLDQIKTLGLPIVC